MKFRDIDDEILAELKLLRQELGSQRSSAETEVDPTQKSPATTAQYFSTGENPLTITADDDWVELAFGFVAREVNIEHSTNIKIAFQSPYESPASVISLEGSGSFTIGGQPALSTAFMWVKKGDLASHDPEIEVVSY